MIQWARSLHDDERRDAEKRREMPRVLFNCHVMGVPNGGSTTHTYNEGEVADITDSEFRLLDGRRTRDGTRWIQATKMEVRKVEPVSNEIRCQLCSKRFKYPSDLKRHMESHNEKGAYVCKECGATFSSPQALGGHSRSHSEIFRQNRVDPVTGRTIPKTVRLDRTPFGSSVCQQCGRSFQTKQGLTVHIGRAHGSDDALPNL